MESGVKDFVNRVLIFSCDYNWRRLRNYLSWLGIVADWFEEGDVEHRVDFYGRREGWFVGVGADNCFDSELSQLFPIQFPVWCSCPNVPDREPYLFTHPQVGRRG